MKSRKVLFSGYYGFGNTGDEAILQASVEGIKKAGLIPMALSHTPEKTSSWLNIETFDRKKLGGIFGGIGKSELVLSGGGGLLQDVTSLKSLIYYLRIPFLAKCLRKKTMIFAQGIGPIQTKRGKFYTKLVLNHFVDKITVRDQESKKLLQELGVRKQIDVTADMAFLLDSNLALKTDALSEKYGIKKGKCYGIVLRNWNGISPLLPLLGKAISEFSNSMSLIPVLLSFQSSMDNGIMLTLQKEVSVPSLCITDPLLPQEFLNIISNFEFLIGMRYHALVFSSLCRVPFGGIAYDPKVKQYAQSLNFPWISWSDLDREKFLSLLSEVWEQRESLKQRLNITVPLIQTKAAENLVEAYGLIKN